MRNTKTDHPGSLSKKIIQISSTQYSQNKGDKHTYQGGKSNQIRVAKHQRKTSVIKEKLQAQEIES